MPHRKSLFIGLPYIDVTMLGNMPVGDDKSVADDYAVSFGGNAVTAAFCCAKLGAPPDLMVGIAPDWLGRMFTDMAEHYGMQMHPRGMRRSALSFVYPKAGQRAIFRSRDVEYLHPYPMLEVDDFQGLHLDGHQPDAALYYAKLFRAHSKFTSLDGGSVRENTDELLEYIDVAVVSVRFCEQMGLGCSQMLDYLMAKGCTVAAVTLGQEGIAWCEHTSRTQRSLPAFDVRHVIDTNGAGDVFHGAYMYSRLNDPQRSWEEHFRFASAAAAHSVQFLGNEASLPAVANVEAILSGTAVPVRAAIGA